MVCSLHGKDRKGTFSGEISTSVSMGPNPIDINNTTIVKLPFSTIYQDVAGTKPILGATDTLGEYSFGVSGSVSEDVLLGYKEGRATAVDPVFLSIENEATGGSNLVQAETMTEVGSPESFILSPSTEEELAQANCFYWFQGAFDLASANGIDVRGNPDLEIVAHVNDPNNIGSAFVLGSEAYFGASGTHLGATYENMAYQSVVAHEAGHFILNASGTSGWIESPHADLAEACADTVAMYLANDPLIAPWYEQATPFLRSGENTKQFCGDFNLDCHSSNHENGEVLMGVMWKGWKNYEALSGSLSTCQAKLFEWINTNIVAANTVELMLVYLEMLDSDSNIYNGVDGVLAESFYSAFLVHGYPQIDFYKIVLKDEDYPRDTKNTMDQQVVLVTPESLAGEAIASVKMTYQLDGAPPVTQGFSAQDFGVYSYVFPPIDPGTHGFFQYSIEVKTAVHTQIFPETGTLGLAIGNSSSIYFHDFEGGNGSWTHGADFGSEDWQWGPPGGGSGISIGIPWQDPSIGANGSAKIWGTDIAGSPYGDYQGLSKYWIRSPLVSNNDSGLLLSFDRWLSIQQWPLDKARITAVVPNIGSSDIWESDSGLNVLDSLWRPLSVDLSAADGNDFQIEFSLETNSIGQLGGWNIDNLQVFTLSPTDETDWLILLSNSTSVVAGGTLHMTILSGPPGKEFKLYSNTTANGFDAPNGHHFDLSGPFGAMTLLKTSNLGNLGRRDFSINIPLGTPPGTYFLEAAIVSTSPYRDSNVLQIDVM